MGSVGDIGVSVGDEAVDRPEKLSRGSSEMVCEAKVESSIAVATICMLRRPPNANNEVLHSSLIGLGVTDPANSSCSSESASRSNENPGESAINGEDEPPNIEGDVDPCVLPLVKGGVDVDPGSG